MGDNGTLLDGKEMSGVISRVCRGVLCTGRERIGEGKGGVGCWGGD